MSLAGEFAFGGPPIASRRAHLLVDNGALLLDVRSRGEFNQRHLPHSLNLPVDELEARRHELPPTTRPIVVYCRSGSRSAKAAALLRAWGYEVCDLASIGNW